MSSPVAVLVLAVLLAVVLLVTVGLLSSRAKGRRAQHLGPPASPDELRGRVVARLLERKKIVAIREVREATGLGLTEAKDLVERIAREERIGS